MIIYFIENLNSEQCTNLFCEQLPLTGSEYNYPVQTPSPSSLCICSAVKSTDLDWVVPPFLQYICTIFKKTRKPFFKCRLRNTFIVTVCFSSIYFIFKQKF